MVLRFDDAQIQGLSRDIRRAILRHPDKVRSALQFSAHEIKQDARRRIDGHPSAVHYPNSIDYDVDRTVLGFRAEIGPDKARTQGALGNILEYGTRNNAPLPHLGPALEAEIPGLVRAIQRIADGTL
jgi:hypothetical protein